MLNPSTRPTRTTHTGERTDDPVRAASRARADLLRGSSIELTTNGRETMERAARILPPGMNVYVPKLPRQTLEDKLVQISILREFGLEPIPHIAARQLAGESELRRFVDRAVGQSAVRRVLIIGGDQPEPCGPYADSAAVIRSGILQDAGISEIDVAGYPEAHPRIPGEVLRADIDEKLRLALESGFRLNIVTQFSFSPAAIIEYCRAMRRQAPGIRVFAGMAGPTSPARLLSYARVCGVTTSLRAVNSLGMNAVRLARHANPDRQFGALAEDRAGGGAPNLAGIHLFSFGGFVESAEWMDRQAGACGLR